METTCLSEVLDLVGEVVAELAVGLVLAREIVCDLLGGPQLLLCLLTHSEITCYFNFVF